MMFLYFLDIGKKFSCCCEQLLTAFLSENAGAITLDSVNAFKASILQHGAAGLLGAPTGGDWLRSNSSDFGGGPTAAMVRRGSEATQMRLWNQRIAQVSKITYLLMDSK